MKVPDQFSDDAAILIWLVISVIGAPLIYELAKFLLYPKVSAWKSRRKE